MAKTVVGLFPSIAAANEVKGKLIAQGVEASQVQVVANDDAELSGTAQSSAGTSSTAEGVGQKIGGFFRSLTGGDEHAHEHYATGVNQGKALLTVTATDEEASAVAIMLREQGALDINTEKLAGTTSKDAMYGQRTDSASGDTAIPIIEEELVVGKREVDRGGVRVYSHVVEHAAEAEVTLRNERVNVERHAVNRPATAADFAGGSYELRATGEEAVVGKTSRVVEEVRLGKQSTDHVEEIHDTVRKTEVEVEQIPGQLESTLPGQYEKTLTK